MYGNVITAEPPPTKQNPGELVQQMAEDGLAFTKKVLSRQNDPSAHNQQLVDSEAEDDEEVGAEWDGARYLGKSAATSVQ